MMADAPCSVLDVAWRHLPLVLLQLVHEYIPPGPEQGPQATHIVIWDYLSMFDIRVIRSRKVHHALLTDNNDTVLARCSEEDYSGLFERFHCSNRGLGRHVPCDYCAAWCGAKGDWIHSSDRS
jgi:hypothetical protein